MEKIAEALLKFQSRNIVIPKNSKINMKVWNHSYSNLDEILSHIRPILTELGLVIFHQIENNKLITTLYHTSGEYLRSIIDIPDNLSPQQLGSFYTYMKRYNISAMLCLASEDDDDANLAENKTVQNVKKQKLPKTENKNVNEVKNDEQEGYVFDFNGFIYNEEDFIEEMKDCKKYPEYKDFETGDFDEMLLFIYCLDLIKDGKNNEVTNHAKYLKESNKTILRQIYVNPNNRLLKLR